MKGYPSPWVHAVLTCRDIASRGSDYLDNRLSILVKVRVKLHLASCASCRVYVAQLSLVSTALRRLPAASPSASERRRLRQEFAARHPH